MTQARRMINWWHPIPWKHATERDAQLPAPFIPGSLPSRRHCRVSQPSVGSCQTLISAASAFAHRLRDWDPSIESGSIDLCVAAIWVR